MQASFAAFIFVSCGRRAACGCAAVIEATRQSLRTVTALPSERHRITLVAASPGALYFSFSILLPCLSSSLPAAPQLYDRASFLVRVFTYLYILVVAVIF